MSASSPQVGATLGRYLLTEKIGSGGMGVVYRARDERLNRDVAIKVLNKSALTDDERRRRFRQEALALSRLNHPNIGTVYDFDQEGDIDFLVMELVAGQSLDTALTASALPEKRVVQLAMQLAEGLAAAHKEGVVHRDLKPHNLRLTPDGRLKILDFGLAKFVEAVDEQATTRSALTTTQTITGTLPYMAPEQLRGEPIDTRSDIYAAGAVMYEMATGNRPFPELHGPPLIGAILHEPLPSPSSIKAGVSPSLENIIVKAMDKKPEWRYQSARELLVDLERLSSGAAVTAEAEPRKSFWGIALGALALAVLVVATVLTWRARTAAPAQETALSLKPRQSVAVLGFRNLSGRNEDAWLATALAEMLTTELAAGEKMRAIPGENVTRMRQDLQLPDTDSYAQDTLARIAANLGTDFVVVGSFFLSGSGGQQQLRVDLHLQNTRNGETLANVSETGKTEKLLDLVSQTGTRLRSKLGLEGISAEDAALVSASLPRNSEAARLYAQGLARLRMFDDAEARDLLQRAAQLEPGHAGIRRALSQAWDSMGVDAKAREEAQKAFELSGSASREERLAAEARYRETEHEYTKAEEAYRALFTLAPDNLDYGLRLAQMQVAGGDARKSMATVDALRRIPGALRDDPRIDLAEAEAARHLSDYKRGLAATQRAQKKAEALGARHLLAMAYSYEANFSRRMGDYAKAEAASRRARDIFVATGDRRGEADSFNALANIRVTQGDAQGARTLYEQGLAIFREIGNKKGQAATLDNIASIISDQGDIGTALKMTEQALALYREVGTKTEVADTLNNYATEFISLGRIAEAAKYIQQSLQLRREMGDKSGIAVSLTNLGEGQTQLGDLGGAEKSFREALQIFRENGESANLAYPAVGLGRVQYLRGDLAAARATFEEALKLARAADDQHQAAFALSGLGDVLTDEGDLAGARQHYQEGKKLREDLGEKTAAAENAISLARVTFMEGATQEVLASAREAIEVFHSANLPGEEAWARGVLAAGLLLAGQPGEAAKEGAAAKALAGKSEKLPVRAEIAVVAARIGGITKKAPVARALQQLELARSEAEKYGLRGLAFEARLATLEVMAKSGEAVKDKAEKLSREAEAAGYRLVARRAKQLETQ